MATQAQTDALVAKALKDRKTSVDGTSTERRSVDELKAAHQFACDAELASEPVTTRLSLTTITTPGGLDGQ